MRVGVYDRYWSTLGGGEQFAGGIAVALAARHDVVLLGPEPIDAGRFRDRLGLDVSDLPLLRVRDDTEVEQASAEVDLFVNCTYRSPVASRAPHGLYVVHFPGAPSRREHLIDTARASVARAAVPRGIVLRSGILPGPSGTLATTGLAVIEVHARRPAHLQLDLSAVGWPHGRAPVVTVRRAGQVLATMPVDGPTSLTVTVPAGSPVPVIVESETTSPPRAVRFPRGAQLGVSLTGLRLDGRSQPLVVGRRSERMRPVDRRWFLGTYDKVAANSQFTEAWIRRLWGMPAEVLYPPVQQYPARGPKRPLILSVGRFFDATKGHSKKQLEMVEAFVELHRRGMAPGWELHLVGGCDAANRAYAMAVKKAAVGAPVRVHINARFEVLRRLLDEASVYWHAAGFGEDPDRHPDRFEHFGISVVEAMSAGLVPVVFGAAGPAEIVTAGVDGLLFGDVAGLIGQTAALAADAPWRSTLSEAAVARAAEFAPEAFAGRLHHLVDTMVS